MPNQPNAQMGAAQPTPPAQNQAQSAIIKLPKIDLTQFDTLQGDEKNNFVGNLIYPLIQ